MKSRVLCLLADGFEEIEFVVPVDLLRRAGIEVLVSSLKHEVVTGRSGIRVIADGVLEDQAIDAFQMLLIPGGPGVNELRSDARVMMLARE
ncbi:MAG: DJ-1/PfpI family protein, partial [Luteolibacter sp.]